MADCQMTAEAAACLANVSIHIPEITHLPDAEDMNCSNARATHGVHQAASGTSLTIEL